MPLRLGQSCSGDNIGGGNAAEKKRRKVLLALAETKKQRQTDRKKQTSREDGGHWLKERPSLTNSGRCRVLHCSRCCSSSRCSATAGREETRGKERKTIPQGHHQSGRSATTTTTPWYWWCSIRKSKSAATGRCSQSTIYIKSGGVALFDVDDREGVEIRDVVSSSSVNSARRGTSSTVGGGER